MEVEAPPRAQWIRTILFEMSPHRQHQPLPRRHGPAARRPDAGLLRLPRPRVRAQPDRGGHRRSLPPELRPHRRPQGRPAQGLDRRDQGRHGAGPRLLRRDGGPRLRQRDLPGPHPRHRRHPRRRRPVLRPVGRQPPRLAASTGTSAATPASAWPTTSSTGRSGPTPTATPSPASGCASRRSARPPRSSTSCSTACPSGPIMAKVPRIIKVPEGEAYVATENPLGEMGYYVVSKGDLGPVPGEDPLGQLQQHLDRAVGAPGRLRARHHHDPREPLLHPRGHRPVIARPRHRAGVLAADDPARRSACSSPCSCPPARSSTSSCSRW